MEEEREQVVFDEVVKESPEAWLLRFDIKEVWVPKSRCSVDEDEGIVEIPMWFIKQKGLEGFIE